jgi:hypothetical protein
MKPPMKGKNFILFLTTWAMEICWLYAILSFSMVTVVHRSYPFWLAAGTLLVSVAVARLTTGKGRRVIFVLALQAAGCLAAFWGTMHHLYYASYPLLGNEWLEAFRESPPAAEEWINIILVMAWVVILWADGLFLARRRRAYYALCSRFDIGLAAFFCLFIVKLLFHTHGGRDVDDGLSGILIFPFFLLGLLSLGMVRTGTETSKGFSPGYRGMGLAMSFAAILLLSAGSAVAFLLPWLHAAANTGYAVLARGSRSIMPLAESILRFIFWRGGSVREASGGSPKGPSSLWSASAGSWWMQTVEKILGYGLWSLLILCMAAVLIFLLVSVIRWLFSRTGKDAKDPHTTVRGIPWFLRFWRFMADCLRWIAQGIRGYHRPTELFRALEGWARRSGISHQPSETPLEFAFRLGGHFPGLNREISVIVAALNGEIYGHRAMDSETFGEALRSWRILRSPANWPHRIRLLLQRPRQ